MKKIPENHNWVKFHHKEWLTKLSIRSCDAATRGIYQDLFSLAMITDETGVIPSSSKDICKQLAIKPSQFKRAIDKLIKVKLCVIGKNNEIILTEIISDFSSLVAQQDPIENQMGAQRVPNGSSTGKENDSLPPKTGTPIIDKNRIDKNKKVSNPLCISPYVEKPDKKGLRLPDDWMPNEDNISYAKNLDLDVSKVAEDFCDYWPAKAGAGARKTNWDLTWKTWCRKEKDWRNVHHFPKQNQQKQFKKEHNLDWMVEEDKQLWGNA